MKSDHRSPKFEDTTLSPLWPLVTILGDIAIRLSTGRADTHAGETPDTRQGAGSDPVSRRDGGRP